MCIQLVARHTVSPSLEKVLFNFNIDMPFINKDKTICWNSLLSLQGIMSFAPLIFVGDFNTTLHVFEKRGIFLVRDSSREYMEDLVASYDLMDIKPPHGRFTWSNMRQGPGHIEVKLDLFLINSNIQEDSIVPLSCLIPWAGYDHRPITLELSSPIPLGPIPFHFNP
jgi:hypothetical protein